MTRGIVTTLCVIALALTPAPAGAIGGGTSAEGHEAVVALLSGGANPTPHHCSGTYLGGRIVVTAAHCVNSNNPRQFGTLRVNSPGMKVNGQGSEQIRVVEIVTDITFCNYDTVKSHLCPAGTVYPGPGYSDDRDIIMLVLERDFPRSPTIHVPSRDQVQEWVAARHPVTLIGYGLTSHFSTAMSFEPFRADFTLASLKSNELTLDSAAPQARICGGDSGGSALLESDGRVFYLGPISAGSDTSCRQAEASTALITSVANFQALLDRAKESVAQRVQQEALAEAKAKPARTTIVCRKGALVRKVTAVAPKCPPGFRKKR